MYEPCRRDDAANSRKKVLVVDDEATICQLMTAFLQTRGYSVDVANNGDQALSRFRTDPPDMVLLDISMPGMQGTDLLEKMKELNTRCGVIVLSAYGDDATINEAMEKGAYCYIQKPMELRHLSDQLQALETSMVSQASPAV